MEFLRRFVQHVLPPHFVKIRHYGLLATGKAHERWQLAFDLLNDRPTSPCLTETLDLVPEQKASWQTALLKLTGIDVRRCPKCGQQGMQREPLPMSRAPSLSEAA